MVLSPLARVAGAMSGTSHPGRRSPGAVRSAGTRAEPVVVTICLLAWFVAAEDMDLSWEIGWSLLSLLLLWEFTRSSRLIMRAAYRFEVPLFCAGVFFFLCVDPLFAVVAGQPFPAVDGGSYRGDRVANQAGLVVSLFALGFFASGLLQRRPRVSNSFDTDRSVRPDVCRPLVLFVSLAVSLAAFAANGAGSVTENLTRSITARSEGYVSFSSVGLGTANPIVALLGQCIPTSIVLWLLALDRRRIAWSAFAGVTASVLMLLYILIGGRSGVVFVVTTLVVYLIVSRRAAPRAGAVLAVGLALVGVLAFQSNFRDVGHLGERTALHSPFRGFALNREVAFAVAQYGGPNAFICKGGVAERAAAVLPDTAIVFFANPIPRKYWPSKPVDPTFGPFNSARTGRTGFGASSNITPTIPGRYYAGYGLVGVAQIALVYGLIWRLISRLMVVSQWRGKHACLVGAMLHAVMFISIRDFTFGKFYPVLFLIAFMLLSRLRTRA